MDDPNMVSLESSDISKIYTFLKSSSASKNTTVDQNVIRVSGSDSLFISHREDGTLAYITHNEETGVGGILFSHPRIQVVSIKDVVKVVISDSSRVYDYLAVRIL